MYVHAKHTGKRCNQMQLVRMLTHRNICVTKYTITASDKDMWHGFHQVIIWTNGGTKWLRMVWRYKETKYYQASAWLTLGIFYTQIGEVNIKFNVPLLFILDMTYNITRYELWLAGDRPIMTTLSLCIDFTQGICDRQHPGTIEKYPTTPNIIVKYLSDKVIRI